MVFNCTSAVVGRGHVSWLLIRVSKTQLILIYIPNLCIVLTYSNDHLHPVEQVQIALQLITQQLAFEEKVRNDGDSGITKIRLRDQGYVTTPPLHNN